MRISQLAERTGVPSTTLRYYESAGLVPADRTVSGYRVYTDRDVDRIAFIRAAKQVGLSLDEIRDVLDVWEHDACADVRDRLRPMVAAHLEDVTARTADLSAFSDFLRDALVQLEALPARAELCDTECGFVTAPAHHTVVATPSTVYSAVTSTEPPVACSLDAGRHEERVQHWGQALAGTVREPIPHGLRLIVPSERAGTVVELALAEQRCCPFYDFSLHLQGKVAVLEVRAPESAAEMLRDLFADTSSGGHVHRAAREP
ncbi:MerR family transcriptional regulator [Rhodococcus chondri]|uniref:MerR family transcriptional regulator n=1 Tax=Rhodococcus chondri TaxID=3065941 RepID=A0ABU7JVF7_9NOCA|nr:MerR family transcriptional regulator [Rhodococcus sp. CC-R104]MEE2034007.1 MerR family transcriptional regulator [Rhodococcus sp. CC-R104]